MPGKNGFEWLPGSWFEAGQEVNPAASGYSFKSVLFENAINES
jgi:hypothetical protein